MKIDVEGMEPEVLRGASKFLKTFPNILIVMESVHSKIDNIEKKELLPFGFQKKYFKVDDLQYLLQKKIKYKMIC